MGRMKQYPRYNIVSFRLSDTEMRMLENLRKENTRQDTMIRILSETVFRIEKDVCETA